MVGFSLLQWAIRCVAITTVALLLFGCMETTLGLDRVPNSVRVRARLVSPGVPARPQPNAAVTLFDSTQQVRLDDSRTDAQGTTLLRTENDPLLTTMFVRASQIGTLVPNPVVTQVNLCDSALVTIEYSQPRQCANVVGGLDSVRFTDPATGSDVLLENRPAVVERCYSFQYSGAQQVTVPRPIVPAPFRVIDISINGRVVAEGTPIVLSTSDVISVCFSVSTAESGLFQRTVVLPLDCSPASATLTLRLVAEVVPERCECAASAVRLVVEDPMLLGQTSAPVADVLYSNERSACDITLQRTGTNPGADQRWLLDPSAQQQTILVRAGEVRNISARFRPTTQGNFRDTIFYTARTASGQECPFIVELVGCVLECPNIRLQNGKTEKLGSQSLNDVTGALQPALPCDPGGTVFFDPNESQFVWDLENPSACAEVEATAVLDNFNVPGAANILEVVSGSVTIPPSGRSSVVVNRSNVSIEFARDVARRFPGQPVQITARLRISTSIPGCETSINVVFPIDTVPPLSPPNTIIAYQQIVNPIKTEPDYTVFILDDINGVTAPNTYESYQLGENRANITPQNFGDIFATVVNRIVDATTDPAYTGANPAGQLPRLHIRSGSRLVEGAFWRNMTISEFSQRTGTAGVVARFAVDVNSLSFGITPNAPRQMATSNTEAGNVYAFRVRSGNISSLGPTCNDVYALVFIRGVDNGFGTFAATNRQSQIQFQVIYPVYGR
jgi:hypothetical protein